MLLKLNIINRTILFIPCLFTLYIRQSHLITRQILVPSVLIELRDYLIGGANLLLPNLIGDRPHALVHDFVAAAMT